MRATRSTRFPYLACEDPTQANDDQNVEDGRANDRTDPDVSLGDEHTWGRGGGHTEEEERKSEFRLDQIQTVCGASCLIVLFLLHKETRAIRLCI